MKNFEPDADLRKKLTLVEEDKKDASLDASLKKSQTKIERDFPAEQYLAEAKKTGGSLENVANNSEVSKRKGSKDFVS